VRIHQVGDRVVQQHDREVLVGDVRQLVPAHAGDVPGGLVRAHGRPAELSSSLPQPRQIAC
jgi:hypothetical protein